MNPRRFRWYRQGRDVVRRLFSLSGRDTRLDWWGTQWLWVPLVCMAMFVAYILILFGAGLILGAFLGLTFGDDASMRVKLYREEHSDTSPILQMTTVVVSVAIIIAYFWMTFVSNVRRLHDIDRSAWFLLVGLIPVIGGLWLFIELGFFAGTPGPNKHGSPESGLRGAGHP